MGIPREMTAHLLFPSETSFTAGTWGGAVLTGFAVRCGKRGCRRYFCVERDVVELAGSIWDIKSVQDLTCPYCGSEMEVKPEQTRILKDVTWRGED